MATWAERPSTSMSPIELSKVGPERTCQDTLGRGAWAARAIADVSARAGRVNSARISRRCRGSRGLRNGEHTSCHTRLRTAGPAPTSAT